MEMLSRYLFLVAAVLFIVMLSRTNDSYRRIMLKWTVRKAQIETNGTKPFVIVTAASFPYRYFVHNLHCSILLHGGRRLLVMSLDHEMHTYAERNQIQSAYFPSSRSSRALEIFGTPGFKRLVVAKLLAVRAVLDTGIDAFFVDSDTAFCNDPVRATEEIRQRDSDLVMQRFYGKKDRQVVNSGVYYIRSTTNAKDLLDAVIDSNPRQGDQAAFNKNLCANNSKHSRRLYGVSHETGAFEAIGCMWQNRTTSSFLPQLKFPIGCTTAGEIRMKGTNKSTVQNLCLSREMALLHVSCWLAYDKERAFRHRGLWFTEKILESGVSVEKCVPSI